MSPETDILVAGHLKFVFLDPIDLLKELINFLVQSILGLFGDFGLDEVATKLLAAQVILDLIRQRVTLDLKANSIIRIGVVENVIFRKVFRLEGECRSWINEQC